VTIEGQAAAALAALAPMQAAAERVGGLVRRMQRAAASDGGGGGGSTKHGPPARLQGDLEGVLQGLEAMHAALEAIQRTLARMVGGWEQ